jgi:type I site-specific restriction endonuclease
LQKEAQARIKINHLLESAGWRFFDLDGQPANIQLELHTKITQKDVDDFGEDFESTHKGFVDFLLLDDRGFPLVVLEAKREEMNPLDGKEQARAKLRVIVRRTLRRFGYPPDMEKLATETVLKQAELIADELVRES